MSLERLLVVPDVHCPFEDKRAWKLMLKAARQFKPQIIVCLGDLADFYSVSSHSKDPSRVHQLRDELKEVRRLRRDLDRLGASRRIFLEGNHEHRLRRYLEDKAPELFGMFDTQSLLQLGDWEFVPYRESAKVGKVWFTHDVGGSGKHTTARALETFQHSVSLGHHHQMQYVVQGDATGKHQVGAQFGWLGDAKQADYMHAVKARRSWSLGFGVGYKEPSGVIHLQPCPIVNYAVVVAGRLIRG